jgi:hypothetical protein
VNAEISPLREDVEDLLDSVDAAVFTGDSFYEAPAIARLRYYLARWERELTQRSSPPTVEWESALLRVDPSEEPIGGFSGPATETTLADSHASRMSTDEKVQTLVDLGFEVTFRHFRDLAGIHCRVHEGGTSADAHDFLWGKDLNAALMAAAAVAVTGRTS